MNTFEIRGNQGISKILTGEKLAAYRNFCIGRQVVVITDANVQRLYGHHWTDLPVIITDPGEAAKNLLSIEKIVHELLQLNADRNTFLLGVGGGIVCDMTGFTASIYMRGVRFGYVATTLLAQVDASVGGKNGVNFEKYKNTIGVFNQPDFVICDPEALQTLPDNEISNGFAEIIKHAIIKDEALFSFIENNTTNLLNLDKEVIEHVVQTSVKIKAELVNDDEKDQGIRRLLNFGHTFGHAIEKTTGLGHGKAVSLGMVIASKLSADMGYLTASDVERIKRLLMKFNLPVEIDLNFAEILDAISKDKKREGDSIHFILAEKIGKAIIKELPMNKIINFQFKQRS